MIPIQLTGRDTIGKVGTTERYERSLRNDKSTTMLWSFGLIILLIDAWHRIKDPYSPKVTIVEVKQPENKTHHEHNRIEKLLQHKGKLPVDYFNFKMTIPGGNISKILITSPIFKVQISSLTHETHEENPEVVSTTTTTTEEASSPETTENTITETEPPTTPVFPTISFTQEVVSSSPEITTAHEIAYETNIHLMGLTKESE